MLKLDPGNVTGHQAGFSVFQVFRTTQDRNDEVDHVAGTDETFADFFFLQFFFQKCLILAGRIFILS